MPKNSAGILMYRINNGLPEVLLVHPGGPYWSKVDDTCGQSRRVKLLVKRVYLTLP